MGIFQELQQKGLWTGYTRHVVALNPILESMSARGIPVDPEEYGRVKASITGDMDGAKAVLTSTPSSQLTSYTYLRLRG